MNQKVNGWIDTLERLLNIIRPKAYNAIAKAVVFSGLALIVESQVNFVHAIIVALFEEYIGKSEILRSVLNATSDPTTGITLLIIGMLYHVIVTLGTDFIEIHKVALPLFPSFKFCLLNADEEELDAEFRIRGNLVELPESGDIPEYSHHHSKILADEHPALRQAQDLAFTVAKFAGKVPNKSLYRQRASLLQRWAGSEILYLKLFNESKQLASGVSVRLSIPKAGVLLSIAEDLCPDFPNAEIELYKQNIIDLSTLKYPDISDIDVDSDAKSYYIKWNVNRLQASNSVIADNAVLLNVKETTEIGCTIYCDSLPEPVHSVLVVNPASHRVVELEELQDEQIYYKLCNEVVMDGYIGRHLMAISEEIQQA